VVYPVESPTIYGLGVKKKMFIPYSCLPLGRECGVQSPTLSNGGYHLWTPLPVSGGCGGIKHRLAPLSPKNLTNREEKAVKAPEPSIPTLRLK